MTKGVDSTLGQNYPREAQQGRGRAASPKPSQTPNLLRIFSKLTGPRCLRSNLAAILRYKTLCISIYHTQNPDPFFQLPQSNHITPVSAVVHNITITSPSNSTPVNVQYRLGADLLFVNRTVPHSFLHSETSVIFSLPVRAIFTDSMSP
jgi:hypothetical protein